MIWGLLVGCTADPPPADDSRTEPTAWSWESPDTGTPPVVVSELQADLQANLDATRVVRATDPLNSFRAVIEYATPECPRPAITTTEDEGSTYYFDQLCLAGDMVFKGPALLHTWEDDHADPVAAMEVLRGLPPEARWTGYGFNGQTDIYSTDGTVDFNCSCTMVDIVGSDPQGNSLFFGMAQGPAHYTGPEGSGTWMDDPGIDPAMSLTVTDTAEYRQFQLISTTSGIGGRYDAVELVMDGIAGKRDGDWDCAADSAKFTVDYRDSVDAVWHSVSLTTADASCSLCGTLDNGETVCLDPRYALLDWEVSPWL